MNSVPECPRCGSGKTYISDIYYRCQKCLYAWRRPNWNDRKIDSIIEEFDTKEEKNGDR